MNTHFRKIFSTVNLLLYLPVIMLLWAGLSRKDFSLKQQENSYLIGVSYMTMNNEFYKILNEEISSRVEIEGDRLVLRDPALSVDRQIEQIDEMLHMGIDVLVVTPVDWKSLSQILKKAKEQGVFIVGDYIACCDEEEELLRTVYLDKRKRSAIPADCYVHFDIPLTLEHEKELLQSAGFVIEKVLDGNATILIAGKGEL